MLFSGTLQKGKDLPLVEALIKAGADLNFNKDGKSETPLIGAASLGAEDVGLRLLDAGARPELQGLFGETALHWAALVGEDRLVAILIPRRGPGPQRREVQLPAVRLGDPRMVQPTRGEPRPPTRSGC